MNRTNRFGLAVAAIAIIAIMTGAVALLAPGMMTPEVSAAPTAPDSEPFVYFPAQYVNQATEIEPAPPTF